MPILVECLQVMFPMGDFRFPEKYLKWESAAILFRQTHCFVTRKSGERSLGLEQ